MTKMSKGTLRTAWMLATVPASAPGGEEPLGFISRRLSGFILPLAEQARRKVLPIAILLGLWERATGSSKGATHEIVTVSA
jgi:hypothetical protein